jgi:hypothetical protein
VHFLEAVRRRRTPDPETHGEARVAELLRLAAAHLFERAHERGGASELIEREEAQRVAEDDRHAAALVGARLPAQAPQEQRVRDEAEVRLGLAAAGGEVDEVGELAVRVRRVRERREVHQHEGELEGSPRGQLAVLVARVFALPVGLDRGDVHRLVREHERLADHLVLGEERDARRDARLGALRVSDERIPRVLEALSIELRVALRVEPLAVLLDERRERAAQALGIELREVRHRRHERGHGAVLDVGDFVARDLRGAQRAHLAVCLGDGAQEARVVTDGPLATIAEEQREHARIVVVPGILALAVRTPQEAVLVAEREPHLEHEVEIAILLERRAVVDEEEAEHPRAWLEAFHLGGAQLALEAQPTRAGDTDALLEGRLVERNLDRDGPMRDAFPRVLLLVLAIGRDLDLVVVGVRDLGDERVARLLGARRQVHAEAHRRGEAHGPLGLGLFGPRIVRLALAPRRELAAVRVHVIGLGRTRSLRREEAREVPARGREREGLVGRRRLGGIDACHAGRERTDEVRLERGEQTCAYVVGCVHRGGRRSPMRRD